MAGKPRPGETESGDRHFFERRDSQVLAAVVDGLGHGSAAAEAACRAVAVLGGTADWRLEELFQRCHKALLGSRGVVMSCALLDLDRGAVTWAGIGNVEAILMAPGASSKQTLAVRSGVIGYEVPALHVATAAVVAGSWLVLATDGVKPGFDARVRLDETPESNARRIVADHGRSNDDALALVLWVGDGRLFAAGH